MRSVWIAILAASAVATGVTSDEAVAIATAVIDERDVPSEANLSATLTEVRARAHAVMYP